MSFPSREAVAFYPLLNPNTWAPKWRTNEPPLTASSGGRRFCVVSKVIPSPEKRATSKPLSGEAGEEEDSFLSEADVDFDETSA